MAIPGPPDLPPLRSACGRHDAMGWLVGADKGRPRPNHGGGTFGLASEAAVLPEANLGVVVLTNDVDAGGRPSSPSATGCSGCSSTGRPRSTRC